MPLVAETEIEAFLEAHPDWTREDNQLTRTFAFDDFNEAFGFVTRVALSAEKANHHPDIQIRWNKVSLSLSTHSEGGLTGKDLEFADRCEGLV